MPDGGPLVLLRRTGKVSVLTFVALLFLSGGGIGRAQDAVTGDGVDPSPAALPAENAGELPADDLSGGAPSGVDTTETVPAVTGPLPEAPPSLDASGDLSAAAPVAQESAMDAVPADALASEAAPLEPGEVPAVAAEREPKKFSVRVSGTATYDDNILLRQQPGTGQESDLIFSAGGGFTWQPYYSENRRFSFDYDGTARFYTDHSEYDGDDHVVSTTGFLSRGGTTFSMNGSYSMLSGLDPESRQFQDREVTSFGASFEQRLTGKMTLTAGIDYHASLYDVLLSTEGASGRLGLNWALNAKSTIGLAVASGYTDSDSNGRLTYESLMLTAGYTASEKLRVNAEAGMQRGDTIGEMAGDDSAHLIFGLGGNYKAGEKTDVSLRLSTGSVATAVQNGGAAASDSLNYNFTTSHRFNDRLSARLFASKTTPASAAVANASIERTSFGAGVSRKLGRSFTLSLDGGHDNSDYVSTTGDDTIDREETTWFLRSAFIWRPAESTTVTLFYDFRDNTSNIESLQYDQNRIGISVGRHW